MKRSVYLLAATLAVAQWSALAADPDLSKLPPASTQEGVTYDKDIKPIFEASCTRCHGAQRPRANLRLDSLDGALKGGRDRDGNETKVITPGDSKGSKLVIAVAQIDPDSAMPPKPRPPRAPRPNADGTTNAAPARPTPPPPKPLTPEQVGLIRAWIDQGAK